MLNLTDSSIVKGSTYTSGIRDDLPDLNFITEKISLLDLKVKFGLQIKKVKKNKQGIF